MIRIIGFTNTACLKCDCLYEHMVQVGALVFCSDCYKEEFEEFTKEDHQERLYFPVNKKYKAWLSAYKDKIGL